MGYAEMGAPLPRRRSPFAPRPIASVPLRIRAAALQVLLTYRKIKVVRSEIMNIFKNIN